MEFKCPCCQKTYQIIHENNQDVRRFHKHLQFAVCKSCYDEAMEMNISPKYLVYRMENQRRENTNSD